MSTHDDFNWDDVADDIAIPEQAATAVFTNPNGAVVVRQSGQYDASEDMWIVFHKRHALDLVKAILSKAGLDDLAIVHVSQLRIQNGGGELLQTFPDRATVDAVDSAGADDDLVADSDELTETKRTDKTAAERQRRRREKLKERDNHGESHADKANERDADDSRVTTAPASPDELDFQGGAHQALTH
jgi:hypothetical protein